MSRSQHLTDSTGATCDACHVFGSVTNGQCDYCQPARVFSRGNEYTGSAWLAGDMVHLHGWRVVNGRRVDGPRLRSWPTGKVASIRWADTAVAA